MDILSCTASNGKNLDFVEPQLVSIQPQLVTDLQLVTLGTSATEILAGRTAQLSFRVTNHGPSDSFDSSCLWVFPSDLTLLSRDINEGCSASVSGATTNVNCNMDLLVGNKDRNLLLQLDSSTPLSTVAYSMACTDEAGVQGDSFQGLLTVRTFAEDLRVQLNWLNPVVAEGEELRRQEGGDIVEYEIEMTSGGPSWARDVACVFNFTRIDFYLTNPEEQTFYLDSANFTSSLPTGACSEVGSPSSSPTKTVVCMIDEVGVETSTTFNFELSTAEPLANLSVSISCQSETTPNNFAPISWEAYYDVVNGKVRYTIVPPPEDSSSASSLSSSSASSSASSEQSSSSSSASSSASSEQSSSTGNDDAKARTEEESVGEKPEFIAGLTVGLLVFLLVAVVIALVVLRRRRLLTKQKRINQVEMEMGDVAEYGFKEDAADVEQGEKGRGEAASKTGITWEIQFSDLEFEEEIGRGAFGVVWRGAWRDSEVAIKQLNITQSKQIDSFKAEAELMKRLRPHSNVVLLLGVCTEEHHPFCLVTEYLPEGNLRSFLRGKKGRKLMKDKKTFLRMAREIAAGMNHLHSEGITHRDLACRNLLLASNLSIKVADFGLACEHEDVSNLEEFAADSPLPLKWIAPECLRSHVYSSKADVWSYGVTLWEMANGGADPYPGMTAFEAATSVYDGGSPDIPSTAPQVIQDIMKLCFSHDPDERPTFKDILQQLKNVK